MTSFFLVSLAIVNVLLWVFVLRFRRAWKNARKDSWVFACLARRFRNVAQSALHNSGRLNRIETRLLWNECNLLLGGMTDNDVVDAARSAGIPEDVITVCAQENEDHHFGEVNHLFRHIGVQLHHSYEKSLRDNLRPNRTCL